MKLGHHQAGRPHQASYYDLYVLLDIFSRYVAARSVACSESDELPRELVADAVAHQGVAPGRTVHADPGSSKTSRAGGRAGPLSLGWPAPTPGPGHSSQLLSAEGTDESEWRSLSDLTISGLQPCPATEDHGATGREPLKVAHNAGVNTMVGRRRNDWHGAREPAHCADRAAG